jgi:signal peptidase I
MTDTDRAQPTRGDTVVLTDGRVGVVRSARPGDDDEDTIVVLLADGGTTTSVRPDEVSEVHRPD